MTKKELINKLSKLKKKKSDSFDKIVTLDQFLKSYRYNNIRKKKKETC